MPYYYDKGNELDPAAIPVPAIYLICDKKDDAKEAISATSIVWMKPAAANLNVVLSSAFTEY